VDVELIRQHLFRNPQMVSEEVIAAGILTILQELWYKMDSRKSVCDSGGFALPATPAV
jgi:hypothetical protein